MAKADLVALPLLLSCQASHQFGSVDCSPGGTARTVRSSLVDASRIWGMSQTNTPGVTGELSAPGATQERHPAPSEPGLKEGERHCFQHLCPGQISQEAWTALHSSPAWGLGQRTPSKAREWPPSPLRKNNARSPTRLSLLCSLMTALSTWSCFTHREGLRPQQ